MSRPRLLLDAHAIIAESLLWEPRSGTLFWCDIKAPALFRLDPRTGENRRWTLPEDVGAFALTGGGRDAVVALRSGVAMLSLDSGALSRVATAPWDPRRFRFNEGACDSAGRLWLGCMCDPPPGEDADGTGPLHVWTSAGGLVALGHEARCHNGMAWSAGETWFYMAHSMEKVIYRHAFHAAAGRLGPAEVFVTLQGHGIPDGAAVDEEGAYWCAHHGSGELRRYAPDGTLLRTVALPVSRVTMCAFGGDDMRTLFISSASDQLDASQMRHQPLAGGLFQFEPGVRGLSRPTEVA